MAGGNLKHPWNVLRVAFAGAWLTVVPRVGAEQASGPDPLTVRGYAVSSGAAPGYVDDRLCGSCHTDLYQSYQEVSMAHSGAALAALDRHDAAADSYRRALEIEPSHTAAYLALAETLRAQGDRPAALRMLRHGVKVADRPDPIREALAGWSSEF